MRLCEAAERLFAEKGPDAVTMRQLAAELGVSPMTPYRYFKDKDDILAAVRASGFDRFADALEKAHARPGDAVEKGAAVCEAYLTFAFTHAHAYKLMFALKQPNEADYPELVRASGRARLTMSQYVRGLMEAGLIEGEPEQIGLMFWASIHGAVELELVGALPHGGARRLIDALAPIITRGLMPRA
ncbi:MAG: TetR/AcrR family transcriptional regulator [Cystobacter sp.]